ncbi:MAG: CerR family C-terminal domain-containing protein [Thermodesulfobacteriota bacterium]|nr:CerR family C-terminal domain-containing protein [Thermodesulfobacteriota bacterium]
MDQKLSTRDRIIDCAGDIFGQKGFRETTIRAIAKAAGVNVAAVNYYFRDKEGLYAEVLEDIFSKGFQRFPSLVPETEQPPSPEERLHVFIKGTVYRLLSPEGWGGQRGKGRLIAREMLEFTPAFSQVIQRYIRPHKDELVIILREIVGDRVNQEDILFSIVSILGQCIYYVYATSLIEQIAPEYAPLEAHIDRIVAHVFRFSLGGLNDIKKDKEEA